ncbi:Por secretion system C-terminal sorting domain-containing protein [Ekhidna lutea]|uniref:Por secretion system C-terminal sorting domain-containing protein n=1 Tax=Ekhidna lutea TaxID=447679 RepID=A0A239L633_EKHLU|nr:T9SS type A sorting domain-containing protein [Ekhidna lutea]SNT25283.1 Por secretion system C-terminal sorting domain-containing protein [Ekhidna lutea]
MKRFLCSLLILLCTYVYAGDPNIFYYVNDEDNTLWQLNVSTGVSSEIGTISVGGIEAIAFWPIPNNNILYAANGDDLGTLDTSDGTYTLISEIDGGGTLNGALGAIGITDVDGLSFDPFTGVLWASERRGTNGDYDVIFQIDETTGQYVPDAFGPNIDYIVIDGDGIYDDVDDIAISPTTGLMFAVSNNGAVDQLININKWTGAITVIGNLTFQDVEGMAFANNGNLYGSLGAGNNPNFYEIDPSDASMTSGVDLGDNGGNPDTEALSALVADANTVSGTLFDDQNLNGIRDGEPGLANVTINLYLDNNSNGSLDGGDNLLQRVTTNSLGQFSIYIATTAELLITVDESTLPSNYTLTTTNLQTATFADNVNFSETNSGNNFGAGASTDTDGDGIMDFTEGTGDSDGDGVLDRNDLDSDNDGILDADEGTEDLDYDGVPKYLDLDSDNDGITDAIEANGGAEPTNYSSSSATITGSVGTNGIPDAAETSADSGVSILAVGDQDTDGIEDYWDPDSDNDGILDVIEAGGTDANGDGILDSFSDANGDGISDALLSSPLTILNTDQAYESANALTELPNYLDLDSDNDGIDDTNEGYSTSQTDRPGLITDGDDDGIIDFWDISLGGTPITPNDHDSDGTPDYYDTDSDNDSILDLIEANDADNDGTEDDAVTGNDDNGNGIDNVFDNDCSSVSYLNEVSSDYGEEVVATGVMDIGSSDLELMYDDPDEQLVGIKFSNLPIPNGADILSAYIQFEVDENTHTGTVIVDIFGELVDDASNYTGTNNDISNRTPTSASEAWTINTTWDTNGERGVNQRSPDLSLVIEEIIGQGTWTSGNDLSFILQRNAGDASNNNRTVENDPILVVVYEGGLSYGCGTSVALQDTDSDLLPDFRDNDDDNDGILTSVEPTDSEPNGTPNYLETNTTCSATGPLISGNADAVVSTFNEDAGEPGSNALGAADGTGARMGDESDAILVLDMTDEVRFGEDVTVRLRSSGAGSADIRVQFSNDNVSYGSAIDLNFNNGGTYTDYAFTVNVSPGARYIKLTEILDSEQTLRIDAVSYSFNDCATDTDLDGVLDASDADSDNDGIPDATEGTGDTDGDGVTDDLDLDSDNDGIPDAVEANGGTLPANMTADGQFNIPYAQANDSDDDGLVDDIDDTGGTYTSGTPLTNPDTDGDGLDDRIDVDADGDGIPDVVEAGGVDVDGDGRADSSTDTDNDGLIDTFDSSEDGTALAITSSDADSFPDYLDIDSDNDGITDHREGQNSASYTASANVDTDGDGLDNNYDTDNAGIASGTFDIDSDGTPDYLDTDSDNDGITDLIEGNDADADGVADAVVSGTDTDNDGLDDNFDNVAGPAAGNEAGSNVARQNTDGDSQADHRDADDDADGILTTNEDFNGNADFSDDFTQGGSPVPDYIYLGDTDGDGTNNDLDLDKDNDGITDINEGGGTDPNADADSDGIPNYADSDIAGFIDGNGDGINDNFDNDQDGVPNHFDLDSDNDGVPDAVEANGGVLPTDMDADGSYPPGIVFANDTDNDGLHDTYDPDFATELANADSDGDGIPNSSDLDSDNDGLPDALENGGGTLPVNMTANGQFSAAYVAANDTDNDGIADDVDPDNSGTAITPRSTDNDGLIDAFDRDSDNDGLTDTIEANGTDADGDGALDSFTDTNANGLNDAVDVNASGTALSLVYTDFGGSPDHLDIDSDNDGIVDNIEGQPTIGYNAPQDLDTDGDGIDDQYDANNGGTAITLQDTDGDGTYDYRDLDSDGDGVYDVIEGSDANQDGAQDFNGFGDSDGDGLTNPFDNVSGPASGNATGSQAGLQNSDSDAILDWRDNDDDGDGIPTANEDNNANGNWSDDFTQGGSSPDYLHVDTDFDGDGVLDSNDPDADNDGVPDIDEGFGEDPSADADSDGVPNYLDPDFVHGTLGVFVDSNGDGINDIFDTDLDGIPNQKDRDSDNDGMSDLIEAGGTDVDGNGIADDLTDSDGDGIVDLFDGTPLALPDTDGDGLANVFDADADGDGVVDAIENGQADADGNGRLDGFTDTDGDGFDDRYNPDSGGSAITIADTDGDGFDDYLEADSDNDGISDNIEAQTTAGFTAPAGADADRDGIDDNYDSDSAGTPISEVDTDGDGTPDFQDTDSDGDSVLDVIEGSDANSDGIADWDGNSDDVFDPGEGNVDTDNDGILDAFDPDNGGSAPGLQNTDSADEADYRDADDDNDTINTIDETNDADTNGTDDYLETDTPVAGDTDGDGVADGADEDDDNDGIPDVTEGTGDTDGDGITDDLDLDSDNDGIPDAIEANGGTLPPNMTPEGRFIISYAVANDGDNDGLIDDVDGTPLSDPDFDSDGLEDRIDKDADNDGIPDIIEAGGADSDGDGEVDDAADVDGDGLADIVDYSENPGDHLIPGDKDGDGNENYIDLDSDGDTIYDLVEEQRAPSDIDTDDNGIVDGATDADNDGVLDSVDPDEGGFASLPDDFDGDGLADYLDLDSDGDGLPDATEGTVDTDGDGYENYIDIDSDGDGITDNREGQASSAYRAPNLLDDDNDGLDNRYDTDNGGTVITIVNTDSNGSPDYLDTDSDDDGIPDSIEGHDADQDGVADRTAIGSDLDQDGLDDSFDTVTSGNSGNSTGSNAAVINTDGGDQRNWQDTDDDNDGALTSAEDDNSNGDWSDDFTQGQSTNTIPDYLYNESTNPLPVELLYFNSTLNNSSVVVSWATASETNNDHFSLHRSFDGKSWEQVVVKNGAGDSNELIEYEWVDSNYTAGIRFYQLKQTDFDGHSETFEIIDIEVPFTNLTVTIYPNPAEDYLIIENSAKGTVKYRLVDLKGKVIIADQYDFQTRIDITKLTSGLYLLYLDSVEQSTVQKIVIKR